MTRTRNKAQIVPSQMGMGTILKGNWLKVPPHQREYRWTERHVNRLFEDLQLALTTDDEPQYFLGTIVTIPDQNGVLEIIDGQQRLATISILLSAIRRHLEDIEPELALSLTPFLAEFDRNQRTQVPKLKLNLLDNDYFGKLLTAKPPYPELPKTAAKSHRRLRAAFIAADEYVRKIVGPANKTGHGDTLNRWIELIEKDADVILFRVPTGANAYKMFETLNDRGLRTTQADLVKSYLFGKAEDRYPEAQEAWSKMIGALSSLQGDDDDKDDEKGDLTVNFLRTALMCIQGNLTRGRVFEVVQSIGRGPQTVITFLTELEKLAQVYDATFHQDHKKWKGHPDITRRAIATINDFDIKPFRPAIVAIASKFEQKEASAAFVLFVSLSVRLLFTTGTRSGSVEETFAALAQRVYAGEITTAAEVRKYLKGKNLIPTNDQFREAFETATVTSGPFARYYLRSLERVAQEQRDPWWLPNEDKETMTLEHVLPQEPEGNWPQFTDEEVKTYAKRIGNLCLLPKGPNSDLKSADQETKFAVYADSPYVLTSQIVDAGTWNANAICQRQMGLAELALKAWPL